MKKLSSEDIQTNPLIAVVMGSDSDLPTLQPAIDLLQKFKLTLEIRILSAHRTPLEMIEFAKSAKSKGIKVIIAGAGGAAHLPGMIASLTSLPVIGVPVITKALSGIDSMYSILQMPSGVPVATVAINGASNAGLLAAQIIGTYNSHIQEKICKFKTNLHDQVISKDQKLRMIGVKQYLSKMKS